MEKIYIKGFENLYMDSIAAIYQIEENDVINTKHAIHSTDNCYYNIDENKKYLIVCGKSDYMVENAKIRCIFRSKSHPYS